MRRSTRSRSWCAVSGTPLREGGKGGVMERTAALSNGAVTGVGASFGTFGELLQGALAGQAGDFLVTLPIARWSRVRISLEPGAREFRVTPEHKRKSLHVVRSILASRGLTGGGTIEITSDLPEGK